MVKRLGWWLTGASALAFVLVGVVVVEATLAATSDPSAGTASAVDTAATSPTTKVTPSPTPTPTLDPTATPSPTPIASAAPTDDAPDPHGVIRVPMSHVRPQWTTSQGSVLAQASKLMVDGDAAGARALLEPRLFGTARPTSDAVLLLRGICKAQHDKLCLSAIDARHPQ